MTLQDPYAGTDVDAYHVSEKLAIEGTSVVHGTPGPLVSRTDADKLLLQAANVRELLNELIQIAPVSSRQIENHPYAR